MEMVRSDIPLSEKLQKMAGVDVKTVDPNDLVDIAHVEIDRELPVKDRVLDYVRQIKNPYCYISHGVIVKISFAGKKTLEECLAACVSAEA